MLTRTIKFFLLNTFIISFFTSALIISGKINASINGSNNNANYVTTPADNNGGHQFRKIAFFANNHIMCHYTDVNDNDVTWVAAKADLKNPDSVSSGLYQKAPNSTVWSKTSNAYALTTVQTINSNHNGDLLIGGLISQSGGYGLLLKPKGTRNFKSVEGFKNKNVLQIYATNDSKVWVVTSDGHLLYSDDAATATWKNYSIPQISAPQISLFFESSVNDEYLLNQNCLWYKQHNANNWNQITTIKDVFFLTSIAEGTNGVIYLGSMASGLFQFNPRNAEKKVTITSYFTHQQINLVYFDKHFNFWVSAKSTKENSQWQLWQAPKSSTAAFKFVSYQEIRQANIAIYVISIDADNNYWISTSGGVWNGFWGTKNGYYLLHQDNTGIFLDDETHTYDEILSAAFQIVIIDPQVTSYSINGTKHDYIAGTKSTIIKIDPSQNSQIHFNESIKFQINFGKESGNSIKQTYLIKPLYKNQGNKKSADIANIFQIRAGQRKTAQVALQNNPNGQQYQLVYALEIPNFLVLPIAEIDVVNLRDFYTSFTSSLYNTIIFRDNRLVVEATQEFINFNTSRPQIPPLNNGEVYQFILYDLVGNQQIFFLQLGGSQINPMFVVIHHKFWFFQAVIGQTTFVILIIISLGACYFFVRWLRKGQYQKSLGVTEK